jgi:hypothetical protein
MSCLRPLLSQGEGAKLVAVAPGLAKPKDAGIIKFASGKVSSHMQPRPWRRHCGDLAAAQQAADIRSCVG